MTASRPAFASRSPIAERSRDRTGSRDSDQQTLMAGQGLGHLVGVLGRHLDVLVREMGVVDLRNDRGRHVLQAFEAVERRVRLHRDATNRWVQLLEPARRSHERAAGPKTGDEVRHLALGLLPDLVRRRAVVRLPVGIVRVLIRVEVLVRLGGCAGAGFADGPVRSVGGVGPDDLGSVGREDPLALRRDVRWHAERHRKSHGGPEHRVGDPGISAGRVEQAVSVLEESASLRVGDDGRSCTILHRSARDSPTRPCRGSGCRRDEPPAGRDAPEACSRCDRECSCRETSLW